MEAAPQCAIEPVDANIVEQGVWIAAIDESQRCDDELTGSDGRLWRKRQVLRKCGAEFMRLAAIIASARRAAINDLAVERDPTAA